MHICVGLIRCPRIHISIQEKGLVVRYIHAYSFICMYRKVIG